MATCKLKNFAINMNKITIVWVALFSLFFTAKAQDTLHLNLRQTDSIFLTKNLSLLAARYKVDASKALVQQAKLWDNPTLSTEWNLYNGVKKQFFDVGSTGQKIISIEQVVSIAGKRNKHIQLAKANLSFSQLEFYELMRSLKTELHVNFYKIYYTSITIDKYKIQLEVLGGIIDALQLQNKKGNIPLKDVLRLKTIYYQLNNERTELVSEQAEANQQLKTLLQTTSNIVPLPDDKEINKYNISNTALTALQEKAINNRPDLKQVENLNQQAELSYKLQRSMAYPDLRIGATYDQSGSYINNYTGVTVGFDLPILNRNQGNIKYAKAIIQQNKLEVDKKTITIKNEVAATFQKVIQVEQEYQKIDEDFDKKFEELNQGVIANFQKRNLSLIEFTDFLEAYNNSVQQINKLKQNRIETYEELNYVIGEELFK